MTSHRAFKPEVSPSSWGDGDSQTPIVRIYGGVGKRGVAVGYDEIPALIERLRELHREHLEIESIVERLVIE